MPARSAARVHIPAGHPDGTLDIPDDGAGNDLGGILPRWKHLQFHVFPVEGQRGALGLADRDQHGLGGHPHPGELLHLGFILLGIPLTLGILSSYFLPKVAEKMKKPFQWLSILFFIAMVILSFAGNLEAFLKCVKYIFLVVLIHNLLALGIGFGTGTVFKVPFRDRRTLTIETGIQNSGLGLVLLLGTPIFAGFPPHGGMLVITAWWGIWHIISGLTISTIFNLKDKKV